MDFVELLVFYLSVAFYSRSRYSAQKGHLMVKILSLKWHPLQIISTSLITAPILGELKMADNGQAMTSQQVQSLMDGMIIYQAGPSTGRDEIRFRVSP